MATITGFTAERMLEIEEGTVVEGVVTGGHLILTTRGGVEIDAGPVVGPTGATGATGPAGADGATVSINTMALRPAATGARGFFYATDEHALFVDSGTWKLVAILVDGDLRTPDTSNLDVTFTYTSGNPTTITYKDNAGAGTRRVEDTITYNTDGTVNVNTRRFYSTDGTTVLSTVTSTYAYSAGQVSSISRVIT